eukprot:scaffold119931_cov57-Phaeocystis_antarctica.AAC.3
MAGGSSLTSTSLVSGTDAARCAAARPSGERATHSAASSAVAKPPRCTFLPPRSWTPAVSAPPPAPAAAPPRSSAAPPLQPAPLLAPAPPAIARRTAPPPRRWRSCPGALACHRATPAPDRA